jgi:quercetin dioxygenase-like cupin family protein
MKTIFSITFLTSLVTISAAQNQIFPKGQRAPKENMTGVVWLNPLIANDSSFAYHAATVTFEPGARTNWHYHPAGQALLVTEGIGYYQERGKPGMIIQKGDVIKCSANVEHWHGATHTSSLTHIGITNTSEKGIVIWLKPVSEEEYNSLKGMLKK